MDMSLSLFGERISMPICLAPVGVQAMANTMAEKASAQGRYTFALRGGEQGTFMCKGQGFSLENLKLLIKWDQSGYGVMRR